MQAVIRQILIAAMSGLLLFLCLGAEYIRFFLSHHPAFKDLSDGIHSIIWNNQYQWVTALVLLIYFLFLSEYPRIIFSSFGIGGRAMKAGGLCAGEVFFGLLIAFAAARYFIGYDTASRGVDFLVLICGASAGKAALVLCRIAAVNSPRKGIETTFFLPLISLLTMGALFHPAFDDKLRYHAVRRWTGLWENPNAFGILMGVGIIIGLSQFAGKVLSDGPVQGGYCFSLSCLFNKKSGLRIFYLAAAAIMGVGLLKSYSRGGWFATVCGLGYLLFNLDSGVQPVQLSGSANATDGRQGFENARLLTLRRLRHNALLLCLVFASILFIMRYRDNLFVRRAVSVANANDFSSRNRMSAAVAGLQMIGARPWGGFGWEGPGNVYNYFYRPAKLVDGQAIFLDDYFMFSMILGFPALMCLLGCIYSKFARGHKLCTQTQSRGAIPLWDGISCRAGIVVLLVGFAPEHGILYITTGSLFWMLMELSVL
jgi:hypothetical protein